MLDDDPDDDPVDVAEEEDVADADPDEDALADGEEEGSAVRLADALALADELVDALEVAEGLGWAQEGFGVQLQFLLGLRVGWCVAFRQFGEGEGSALS